MASQLLCLLQILVFVSPIQNVVCNETEVLEESKTATREEFVLLDIV